jgi:hypothetical protein
MNPYKREGLFYVARLVVKMADGRSGTLTLSLDFVTYHLIRLIHGEQGLFDMVDRSIDRWKRD